MPILNSTAGGGGSGLTVAGSVNEIQLNDGSSDLTAVTGFSHDGTTLLVPGATTFNEAGADVDFRVEGSGEANALFVQGSDGFIGIGTGAPSKLLTVSATSDDTTVLITSASANDNPARLTFQKARGTIGSPTIVQDNDFIGIFRGEGYDGAAYQRIADMRWEIDGTPGTGDMPGRIKFLVTPDGSATLATALTINNQRVLFIANSVAAPSSTPSGGGYLYVDAGELKYKGSSGTVTSLGPA